MVIIMNVDATAEDIKEVIEAANVGNKCGGCRGDLYELIDTIKAELE